MTDVSLALKESYILPEELQGQIIKQFLILKESHYFLTGAGSVYQARASGNKLSGDWLDIAGATHMTGDENSGEIYFLHKNGEIHFYEGGNFLMSRHLINRGCISDFYSLKHGNQDLFFCLDKSSPSYTWYDIKDLFEVSEHSPNSLMVGNFNNRNLFGGIGSDEVISTSILGNHILFLTRNHSGSRFYGVMVDVLEEKTVNCFRISNRYDFLKGLLFDKNIFILCTHRKELIVVYSVKLLVKYWFENDSKLLTKIIRENWQEWRKKNNLTEQCTDKTLFRYTKSLLHFIEKNYLKDKYADLVKKANEFIDTENSYSFKHINLSDIYYNFKNIKIADICCFNNYIYILSENRKIFKLSFNCRYKQK
jgi:hypothetical protein